MAVQSGRRAELKARMLARMVMSRADVEIVPLEQFDKPKTKPRLPLGTRATGRV